MDQDKSAEREREETRSELTPIVGKVWSPHEVQIHIVEAQPPDGGDRGSSNRNGARELICAILIGFALGRGELLHAGLFGLAFVGLDPSIIDQIIALWRRRPPGGPDDKSTGGGD